MPGSPTCPTSLTLKFFPATLITVAMLCTVPVAIDSMVAADDPPRETAATLQETATRLNKLAIDAPSDLTINRELVNMYQRLASHYQQNKRELLAEQAQNRARLAVDQFAELPPLEPHADKDKKNETILTEISDLQRHGEAGRLAYPFLHNQQISSTQNGIAPHQKSVRQTRTPTCQGATSRSSRAISIVRFWQQFLKSMV